MRPMLMRTLALALALALAGCAAVDVARYAVRCGVDRTACR